MKLPVFAQDKVNHYAYGTVIALLTQLLLHLSGQPLSREIGIACAVTVGALKEVYDLAKVESHDPSVVDFLATTLGGAVIYMAGWPTCSL